VDWNFNFRRRLGEAEVAKWDELINELEIVELSGVDDEVIWAL